MRLSKEEQVRVTRKLLRILEKLHLEPEDSEGMYTSALRETLRGKKKLSLTQVNQLLRQSGKAVFEPKDANENADLLWNLTSGHQAHVERRTIKACKAYMNRPDVKAALVTVQEMLFSKSTDKKLQQQRERVVKSNPKFLFEQPAEEG